MQQAQNIAKICIVVLVVCISLSCNNDNPVSSIIPTPNLTEFSGRIENWDLGDTVMIHSISSYIDYPLSPNDSNDIYGSSTIGSNGYFSMRLKDPKIVDSLYGYSYKLLFPYDHYSNFFNSDTNVRFLLSNFALYSRNWILVPYEVRNASRNISTITDSLATEGEYRVNSVYYFSKHAVTIKYSGSSVTTDTVSIDSFYEFQKGWNKIVTRIKVKRNKFIQLESRVNNSFEGKYFIYRN